MLNLSAEAFADVQAEMAELAAMAYEQKAPLIGLYDSAGARLQEGSENITFARLFYQNGRPENDVFIQRECMSGQTGEMHREEHAVG